MQYSINFIQKKNMMLFLCQLDIKSKLYQIDVDTTSIMKMFNKYVYQFDTKILYQNDRLTTCR